MNKTTTTNAENIKNNATHQTNNANRNQIYEHQQTTTKLINTLSKSQKTMTIKQHNEHHQHIDEHRQKHRTYQTSMNIIQNHKISHIH